MEILVPRNVFLRVEEKFSARFAREDAELKRDPQDVYLFIFDLASRTGVLRGVSQQTIADRTKMCLRAVQHALGELEELGYLHVESTPGKLCTYSLLLSEHVLKQILQYGSDLIQDPDWYPRDGRRESISRRRPAQASTLATASSPTAPPAAVSHPRAARGGYAPHAYPSYNDIKSKKEISPLAPLKAQGAADSAPPRICGGDVFPAEGKRLPARESAFERLWGIWPIKQDRTRAWRVFASLARAGKLPPLKTLLHAVDVFRERDARWKRGYAPNLGNWLRGRRWEDEPVERGFRGSSSRPCSEPVSAARTDSREKVAAAYVPPEVSLPELPRQFADAVEDLCRLWPQATARQPVKAFFRSLLASGTAPEPGGMVAAAKSYLQESFSPGSLVRWLRSCTA